MPSPSLEPRVRPLYGRPGARYRCFGDGLCCTDIHALGPLSRRELVQVRRLRPDGAGRQDGFDQPMLQTVQGGGCTFLMPDRRCSIHAQLGLAAKPAGCRRFPLGLVATPRGGRITTEHRCPCRTLGTRPEVTPASAEPSLIDDAGRIQADFRVQRVSVAPRRQVSFAAWEDFEGNLLARLARGERPERVLGVRPFPALAGRSWTDEAEELLEDADSSRFGAALEWVADAILRHEGRFPRRPRPRPWQDAFDRAERRAGERRTADQVFADWVADVVWSLGWVGSHPFDRAARELATRLALARDLGRSLRQKGARPDRAAAEAVMVVDVLGASDHWAQVVRRMRP